MVITLRRPEALNALHDELTDEILAVIRRHEARSRRCAGFVIVGYGTKAFCAGADIGRFPSLLGDAEAAAQYARDCSRLLVHLDRARKPVVAALNGMALGGGFELAMRCHALVADRGAWMQLPEVTLGIVPGIGAMVVPYRRWPDAAAVFHGMLTRGERLKAAQAHELGIVDELADGFDDLIARAVARVHALAGRVPTIPDGAGGGAAVRAGRGRPPTARVLSAAVIGLIERAVRDAAAAPTLAGGAGGRLPGLRRGGLHGRGARGHHGLRGAARARFRRHRLSASRRSETQETTMKPWLSTSLRRRRCSPRRSPARPTSPASRFASWCRSRPAAAPTWWRARWPSGWRRCSACRCWWTTSRAATR